MFNMSISSEDCAKGSALGTTFSGAAPQRLVLCAGRCRRDLQRTRGRRGKPGLGRAEKKAFNMEKELVFPMENPKKTHGKSKKTQGFS